MEKCLSILLAAAMLLACLPLGAMPAVKAETSEDFIYTITDEEAVITGYIGTAADMVIPSTLGGHTVTGIGYAAFRENSTLMSITIPNSVTSIGEDAFLGCYSLSSVTYCGTNEQWYAILIGNYNSALTDAIRYYHDWQGVACVGLICSVCGESADELAPHTYPSEAPTEVFVQTVESAHNYANSMDRTWTVTKAGAESLSVAFSSETKTESLYDCIYLYDGSGAQIGQYSGIDLASKTITVLGDTVEIKLTSDDSVTNYGFHATIYEIIPGSTVWTVRTPATCSTAGEEYTKCTVCGYEQTREIAAGHSWQDAICTVCSHPHVDADGDGLVTLEDAVYLLYATMLPEEYPLGEYVTDVDNSGTFDADDAIYLLYYCLLPEQYPL